MIVVGPIESIIEYKNLILKTAPSRGKLVRGCQKMNLNFPWARIFTVRILIYGREFSKTKIIKMSPTDDYNKKLIYI